MDKRESSNSEACQRQFAQLRGCRSRGDGRPDHYRQGAIERVSQRIPKQPISADKGATILKIRAEYDFLGKAFYPDNTAWTMLYGEHDGGLAEACYSRVVFVRPVNDVMEAAEFADKYKQTVGVALSEKRRLAFAERATFLGVERCPRVGQMNIFESPWDGMFAIHRLVRWVTTYGDG